MVREGNYEMQHGWPFGLGNMSTRIRLMDGVAQPLPPPRQPRAVRTLSFSSFSSSNLDTESTASFFPDQSMSLGRLIGIRTAAANKRSSLYHELRIKDIEAADDERSSSHHRHQGVSSSKVVSTENYSQGLCVPLLHHMVGRISRSRSTTSRH